MKSLGLQLYSMLFISLLLVVSTGALAQDATESNLIACDGVVFNHVYFDKKLLFTKLGRPNNLVMHKFSNTLFFSHTVQNGTQVDFAIMGCSVDKLICKDIPGIPGGYAVAYDDGNDDIYFGGHDGIYKYNFLTKKAEFFAEEGKSIWGLFIKKNFYYIEYPTQRLYVYQEDSFVQVAEAIGIEIDHFFVSKQADVYFSNKTALYKVEKLVREPLILNDEIVVRQIVEDNYGDIYFCASNGIYLEEKPFHKVKNVATINNAFGMVFDEKENVIYSDKDSVYILKPSNYSNLCYNALNKNADSSDGDDSRRSVIG